MVSAPDSYGAVADNHLGMIGAESRFKYLSGSEQGNANVVTGFGVAATLVHVLTQCGADLSRKNIIAQATNINSLELPMLLPGVKVSTSTNNYHPIRQMQLASFNSSSWELFGELLGS
jgi:branched-chain amino acid transport system substrate-binding protein